MAAPAAACRDFGRHLGIGLPRRASSAAAIARLAVGNTVVIASPTSIAPNTRVTAAGIGLVSTSGTEGAGTPDADGIGGQDSGIAQGPLRMLGWAWWTIGDMSTPSPPPPPHAGTAHAGPPDIRMSTPPLTAPGQEFSNRSLLTRVETRVRLAVRGDEADPSWSRPLLWAVALLAGVLGFWGLTRNGYANTYYSEAAQAASRSWTAWITNALDVSGSDSLDKGPLSNMVMGLSGRILGFSSFSMLMPEALAGVGSVVILHNLVKRTLGHRAAILAAVMLATVPIFVAMARFNNPDAILLLSEIAAAWALVRALESGRTRHLLLCGAPRRPRVQHEDARGVSRRPGARRDIPDRRAAEARPAPGPAERRRGRRCSGSALSGMGR